MRRILFICTGNFYRSRLAEILFNYYAATEKLEWEAYSRGLTDSGGLSGISEHAGAYLEGKGLKMYVEEARDPELIRVSDLEESKMIVGINRDEHEGLMREKFGQIPKILEKQKRLRYWNIFDIPSEVNGIARLFGPKIVRPSQPPHSSCEHVDFAVQILVKELTTEGAEPSSESEVSEVSSGTSNSSG